MLWQKRCGRRDPEHCCQGEFIGGSSGRVTVEVQRLTGLLHWIKNHPGHDCGANLVHLEGE